MKRLTIVGDGLAGLMLGHRMQQQEGWKVTVLGDGNPQVPEVGIVHLFAGRSFRRQPLELQAFKVATEFWRASSFSCEFEVERLVEAGDRVDRSGLSCEVLQSLPSNWQPRRVELENLGQVCWRYGPAFSVRAKEFLHHLREELGERYLRTRANLEECDGLKVLALGVDLAELLPDGPWDRSRGCLIAGQIESRELTQIRIAPGLHLAPGEGTRKAFLGGGLVTETFSCPSVESSLGLTFSEDSRWTGERLAYAGDRWPVLGWRDSETLIFGGFGSRALFWLPFCLNLATAALVQSPEVGGFPAQLSLGRLHQKNPCLFSRLGDNLAPS